MIKIPFLPKVKPFFAKFHLRSFPVCVFEKLYQSDDFTFIYESLESKGERGRYSFLGAKPFITFKSKGKDIEINIAGRTYKKDGNPFEVLRNIVAKYKQCPDSVFPGGAVGYISYDAVRFFEKIPDKNPDELTVPDTYFMFPSEIIVFDHKEETVDIIVYSENNGEKRIEELKSIVETYTEDIVFQSGNIENSISSESNFSRESFKEVVQKAREYIFAGDIFQVVLSQRFKSRINRSPIQIYKALRVTNPSPYMYYLKLSDIYILGSSPEILVKLSNGIAINRPLAGTRARGRTKKEDQFLERDLLKDEKELAEHIMLLDLARNDLGRVCDHGSVEVDELLQVERYSKVMHLVSNVVGKLKKNKDAFDLLEASFPAGTVSGAPKVRAMEIIDELEPSKRGIYAGSIGYFSFSGDMDMCIAIRTIIIKDGVVYIQAGAGIVADSEPEKEYTETLNKASALKKAIEIA